MRKPGAVVPVLCMAALGSPLVAQQPVTDTALTVVLILDRDTFRPGERVTATLRVRNTEATPRTLHFTSGQRYDFRIADSAGRDVWVWSSERGFIQAIGQLALEGELREAAFTEQFAAPSAAGRYRVSGEITATGVRLAAGAWLTVTP